MDGSSWPTPTAPVEETTPICQPDSHQHRASSKDSGSPKLVAHRSNSGRRARREGWANSPAGSDDRCTWDESRGTPSVPAAPPLDNGSGTTIRTPTSTCEGSGIPLASAMVATLDPYREAMLHKVSPFATVTVVVSPVPVEEYPEVLAEPGPADGTPAGIWSAVPASI